MPGIFNLAKVENAINNLRPTFVFIVDTNVLMNTPDPSEWKVSGDSALFVLSDTTILELEYIKHKTERSERPEDRDTNKKARALIRSLANLFKNGQIIDGIKTSGGWVITVASPDQKALQEELDKIDDIVKAFGRSDTKMLLLTKECSQLSGPGLVSLVTGELNLHNIAQSRGVTCHLHTGFPISGLVAPEKKTVGLDWDKVLLAIQSTIVETSVTVELTLDSQRCGSDRVGSPIVTAEGSGVISGLAEDISFFWTVKFHVGRFNERPNAASVASLGGEFDTDIPSATLDFADEKQPLSFICDEIIKKLLECAEIPGVRMSLQSPDEAIKCVMEYILFDEAVHNPLSEEEMEEIMKDPNWDKPISWLDWIFDMKEEGKSEYLSMVYDYVHDCWKMGQTYEFRLFV